MANEIDELVSHQETRAFGKIMQLRTYESSDPSVDSIVEVEMVDWLDGNIELAFDMKDRGNRTYLKMRVSDLRRLLKKCEA